MNIFNRKFYINRKYKKIALFFCVCRKMNKNEKK